MNTPFSKPLAALAALWGAIRWLPWRRRWLRPADRHIRLQFHNIWFD